MALNCGYGETAGCVERLAAVKCNPAQLNAVGSVAVLQICSTLIGERPSSAGLLSLLLRLPREPACDRGRTCGRFALGRVAFAVNLAATFGCSPAGGRGSAESESGPAVIRVSIRSSAARAGARQWSRPLSQMRYAHLPGEGIGGAHPDQPEFGRGRDTDAFESEVDLFVPARLVAPVKAVVARANGRLRGRQPKLSAKQRSELRRMCTTGDYSNADLAELSPCPALPCTARSAGTH